MKVLLIGNTGVHHVFFVAHMFLGTIDKEDIFNLSSFGDLSIDKTGYPIYIGVDDNGNEIYTLGVGNDKDLVKKSLDDLLEIFSLDKRELLVLPIPIKGEWFLKIAYIIPSSRSLNLISNLIAKILIKWQYQDLNNLIDKIRDKINNY